jgi:signal transduction histidine kinase
VTTALPLLVAAALLLVAGAATAHPGTDRRRALAGVVGAAVLATTTPAPDLYGAVAVRPDRAAALGLVALTALVAFGVDRQVMAGISPAAVTVLGALLLLDPFRDPACLGQCRPNPWALTSAPVPAAWCQALGLAALAGGIAALTARRARSPIVGVAGTFLAMAGPLAWLGPAPTTTAAGVGCLAVVVLLDSSLRAAGQRARLRRAVDQLNQADDPEDALRGAGHAVRLDYRVDGVGEWVDRDGRPVSDADPGTDGIVEVTGPEGTIARVVGTGSPTQAAAWSRLLRGPARLALDNGRRRAQAAIESRAIIESSRRLVEAADAERLRLERDLHDGAQQHVLALGIRLGLYEEELPPDSPARLHLGRSRVAVATVLDGLRDLAHGIHSTDLCRPGDLAHALRLLATRTHVPLDVGPVDDWDIDVATRVAAFALVEELVSHASGPVAVTASHDDGFRVEVVLDPGAEPPETTGDDRVRALGGRVETWRGPQGAVHVVSVLPESSVPTSAHAGRS